MKEEKHMSHQNQNTAPPTSPQGQTSPLLPSLEHTTIDMKAVNLAVEEDHHRHSHRDHYESHELGSDHESLNTQISAEKEEKGRSKDDLICSKEQVQLPISSYNSTEGSGAEEEESGRDRLKRHRNDAAGRVWIPEIWGQEDLLKDWVDCSDFDSALVPNGTMSARAALAEEGRRATSRRLRVETI